MTQMTQVAPNSADTKRVSSDNRSRQQRGSGGRGAGKGSEKREPQGKRATFPWINGQIIRAADTEDLDHLFATINAHLSQMNLVNLSTALHRVAKMSSNRPLAHFRNQAPVRQTLPALLTSIRESLVRSEATGSSPKCQALSNITWALATMQVVDLPLLRMVAHRAYEQLADFKNFELCQMLWAFAKLGTVDSALSDSTVPLFTAASQYVMRHLEKFTFRGLVMTCWAFATAKQHDARLFRAAATRLTPMAYGANTQELANTAWSFSTAGIHEEQLFSTIAKIAIPQLWSFKPQELSSILWSFASIGHNHDDFYEAAGRASMQMDLQAQQLANILWALTKMRPRHQSTKETLLALLPWCTALIRTFKTQELASVALAAGKCFGTVAGSEETHQPVPFAVGIFFHAVLPLAIPCLREYSGQSLANIASSFLAVQIGTTSGLFDSVGYEVMSRAESLENSALLLLLRTMPHAPRSAAVHSALCQLFAEAARRVESLPSRELQVLARICESFWSGMSSQLQHVNREELRAWCLTLATKWSSGDVVVSEAAGHKDFTDTAGLDTSAGNEEEADPEADPEATEDVGTDFSSDWKVTLTIADTGGRASAWDEKAMCSMRTAVEASAARREEAARERGAADHVANGPDVVPASPDTKEKVQQPTYVCSVKNTFIELEDENDNEEEGDDSDTLQIPLPPALPFIPDSVSAEKLQAYRANYAKFRVGKAIGAKGELDTVS